MWKGSEDYDFPKGEELADKLFTTSKNNGVLMTGRARPDAGEPWEQDATVSG